MTSHRRYSASEATAPVTEGAASAALDALRVLADVAADLDEPALASDAKTLADRVREGRFFVACVGQFKRGKSSLVNALVGADVLPTGVAPVTSVVTVIRYGDRAEAHVAMEHESVVVPPSDLGAYVSEQHNPSNAKGVRAVEVFLPSDLLRSGMCIVDTPGIGSAIAANTAATSAFVPKIDAAVVVLGADPPISADEAALVSDIAAEVDRLLFVMNKADRFTDAERREARAFTERVLRERLGKPPDDGMLEVSALEARAGDGHRRDWQTLVTTLRALAAESRGQLVDRAARRGTRLIGTAVLRHVDERIAALERPLAESERRVTALRERTVAADQSLRDLRHLMAAEQQQLANRLREQQEAFLARVLPIAAGELERFVGSLRVRREPRRRTALVHAQELYRGVVDRWRDEEHARAEQLYRDGIDRFVRLTDVTVRALMQAIGEEAPRLESPFETGFRVRSQLRYTFMLHLTGRSPLRWLVDQLRPPAAARRAVVREALHYLRRLLETNTSRVASDLEEQARESRRLLEREIVRQVGRMCETAERALANAKEQRARGDAAVATALQRLHALRARVAAALPTND